MDHESADGGTLDLVDDDFEQDTSCSDEEKPPQKKRGRKAGVHDSYKRKRRTQKEMEAARAEKAKIGGAKKRRMAKSKVIDASNVHIPGQRGRPNSNPMSVPQGDIAGLALDPRVEDIQLPAAQTIAREQKANILLEKQKERAEQVAVSMLARKIDEMVQAYETIKLKARAQMRKLEEQEALADAKKKQIANLAVKFSEFAVRNETRDIRDKMVQAEFQQRLTDEEKPIFKKVLDDLPKQRRLTEEDKVRIRFMAEQHPRMSARKIGQKFGFSHTTISNVLADMPKTGHQGRKPKLTPIELFACARYMHLKNGATLNDARIFLRKKLGKEVCRETLRLSLKNICGLRFGDFRHMPPQRNHEDVLLKRQQWALQHQSSMKLKNAVFLDEMHFERMKHPQGWSVRGWTPSLDESTRGPQVVTLVMAACPNRGILYTEIIFGGVDQNKFLVFLQRFLQHFILNYTDGGNNFAARPLLLDNAPVHCGKKVTEYMNSSDFAKYFTTDFLPPYSPFLNICEELFGNLKMKMWYIEQVGEASRPYSMKEIVGRMLAIIKFHTSADDCEKAFKHMAQFLPACTQKAMIFARDVYDRLHEIDDSSAFDHSSLRNKLCPRLPDDIEQMLKEYLPTNYEPYTPSANSILIEICNENTIFSDDIGVQDLLRQHQSALKEAMKIYPELAGKEDKQR